MTAMATKSANEKGAHCGNIIKEAAKVAGGGGGGRPESRDIRRGKFDGTPSAWSFFRHRRSARGIRQDQRNGLSCPHVSGMYSVWAGGTTDSGTGPVCRRR